MAACEARASGKSLYVLWGWGSINAYIPIIHPHSQELPHQDQGWFGGNGQARTVRACSTRDGGFSEKKEMKRQEESDAKSPSTATGSGGRTPRVRRVGSPGGKVRKRAASL